MPVKLIAVDMDGTFLDEDKKYNKARFLQQFYQLRQRGIYFVAASGNPLYTLQHYFPEIQQEMAFVAENGAYVMDAGQQVACAHICPKVVQHVLDVMLTDYQASLILCAQHSGYITHNVTVQAKQRLKIYFSQLQQVTDLNAIDQPICKITFDTTQCDVARLTDFLQQQTFIQQHKVKMVSSGFGFIDLILPEQHKAHGLSLLQQKWQIADHQVLAIGDNYNDMEMVEKAGFGFAMANAVPELKQLAAYHAGHHTNQAVLDVIDAVLSHTLSQFKQHPLVTVLP